MIVYIDGDNSPGTKTDKANELDQNDILNVVYGSTNPYYKVIKNRQKLNELCSCKISFREVSCGSNAADFAIAMDAARAAEECQKGIVVLVSDDKHIKLIASQLQKEYPDMLIAQASTLGEAVDSYKILEVSSLQGLQQRLTGMFGEQYGCMFYQKLRQLYLPEMTEMTALKKPGKDARFIGSIKTMLTHFISIYKKKGKYHGKR